MARLERSLFAEGAGATRMGRYRPCRLALVTALLCATVRVHAQPVLSTITTDTGDLAPGHLNFARYTAADMCRAAVSAEHDAARRTLESRNFLDTLHDVRADTLGVAAMARVGETCMARFLRPDVAEKELPPLFLTAVMLRNDTLAQRILRASISATSAEKATVLRLGALRVVLGGDETSIANAPTGGKRQPLMALADAIVADIDRSASFTDRLRAREMLLSHWEFRDSLLAIRGTATDIVTMFHQAPLRSDMSGDMRGIQYRAYADLMTVTFLTSPTPADSMVLLAKRMQADSASVVIPFRGLVRASTLPVNRVVDLLSPVSVAWDSSRTRIVPRLHAAFWYPSGVDTVQPARGTVTVLVTAGDPSIAQRIRRWCNRYSPRDVSVTVVHAIDDTTSYAWNGIALAPAQQALEAQLYYREYERLPVTVAVQAQHVEYPVGERNGRRTVKRPIPFADMMEAERPWHSVNACSSLEPGCLLIAGRDGTILWAGNLLLAQAWHSSPIDDLLAWAVAQHQ